MLLAQELVTYAERLATPPDVYLRVRTALDDARVSAPEIADVISSDPAMTASLLRMANSAYYGYARKIESIDRAVGLIGLDEMHELVLATSVGSDFQGIQPERMDMSRFWRNSVRRALLARTVASTLEQIDPQRLFTLALLADIGHLVMYVAIPDLMAHVLETQPLEGESLADLEHRIVGCSFAEVGAALCSSWHLPVSYGVLIGSQLDPATAGEYARTAALLNLVSAVSATASGAAPHEYPPHPDAAEIARVEIDAIEANLTFVKPQLDLMLAVFSAN